MGQTQWLGRYPAKGKLSYCLFEGKPQVHQELPARQATAEASVGKAPHQAVAERTATLALLLPWLHG